jgi:hypothetical protein
MPTLLRLSVGMPAPYVAIIARRVYVSSGHCALSIVASHQGLYHAIFKGFGIHLDEHLQQCSGRYAKHLFGISGFQIEAVYTITAIQILNILEQIIKFPNDSLVVEGIAGSDDALVPVYDQFRIIVPHHFKLRESKLEAPLKVLAMEGTEGPEIEGFDFGVDGGLFHICLQGLFVVSASL